MPDDNSGDWREYRLLVLEELKKLNQTTGSHGEILGAIDKTLVRHDENLEKHMGRTEIAEKRLELITTQIAPLVKASWLASFFLKLSTGFAFTVGTALGIIQLYQYFAGK